MAPRSAVDLLPNEILEALNARLVDQAFSDYIGLAAWLNEQGYWISKTAVWRHGSDLQAKMEKSLGKARERMEIAKALRGASDDEKAALMEATEMVAMDQLMDMFEVVAEMSAANRLSAVPKLVRAIADLNRSATGTAKWKKEFEADIRKQARAEAAEELTQELKNDGISAELEASIKRILLGK